MFVQLPVASWLRGNGSDVLDQGVKDQQVGENHHSQWQNLVERKRSGCEGRALLVAGKLPGAAQQRPCGAADHHQLHGGVAFNASSEQQRRDWEDQISAPHQSQHHPHPPPLPLQCQRSKGHMLSPQGHAVEDAERQRHPAAHGSPPHPQQHEDPAPARRQGYVQAQVGHEYGHGAEKRGEQVGQRQVD